MSINIILDVPPDVEEKLRRDSKDLAADVKEAYALDVFRRGKLTYLELSHVLGLDRIETDGWLKRHQVAEHSPTAMDLESDRQTIERALNKA